MGIRGTLMGAAGVFVVTIVSFAAAIVIAHSLVIPDPVGRILPIGRSEMPGTSVNEGSRQAIVPATDPGVSQTPDDIAVPEVTAEPAPPVVSGGDRPPAADTAGPDAFALDRPREAAADDVRNGGLSGPDTAPDPAQDGDPHNTSRDVTRPPPPPTDGDDGGPVAAGDRLESPRAPQPTQSPSPSPEYETPTVRTPPSLGEVHPPSVDRYRGRQGDGDPHPLRDALRWRFDRRSRWDSSWQGSADSTVP
jgi:hypothetical protein